MNDRQQQFMAFFPPIGEIPQMEPEELGPFIRLYTVINEQIRSTKFNAQWMS